MSRTVYLYNVYDNGKLLLKNVTPMEIKQYLGTITNVTTYANSGHKYKGRYTFEFAASMEQKTEFELAFEKEWNEVTEPLKRVIWVTEGGRKLVGSKK